MGPARRKCLMLCLELIHFSTESKDNVHSIESDLKVSETRLNPLKTDFNQDIGSDSDPILQELHYLVHTGWPVKIRKVCLNEY